MRNKYIKKSERRAMLEDIHCLNPIQIHRDFIKAGKRTDQEAIHLLKKTYPDIVFSFYDNNIENVLNGQILALQNIMDLFLE